jgi:hypothetical protein
MHPKISFGTADDAWKQHGLQELPVRYNGGKTPFKAITRHGEFVTILGRGYYLFPNEEAFKLATQAADLVGLKPFAPKGLDGTKRLRQQGNVFYNREQTLMHAWYAPPKTYDVEGEQMHIGCDVVNSIDGSTSFGCSVFTYRGICANGVIFGYRELAGFKRMHTKGMENILGNLKTRMVSVMDTALATLERYQELAENPVTTALVEKIRKSRLPKKVLPDYLQPDAAEEAALGFTEWQLYNDITQEIWHNAKTGLRTKTFQFATLHRALKVHA